MMRVQTRIRSSASGWVLAGVVALLAAAPGIAAAQAPAGGLVVFGTSLSDPGNAFALLRDLPILEEPFTRPWGTPPDYSLDAFLIPHVPYARGGHHLSNGATWVERLGRSLGLAAYAAPAFRSSAAKASNYAIAGARASASGLGGHLPFQVAAFLHATGGVAPSDALYVMEMGGNDVRDALQQVLSTGSDAGILDAAATSIATHIATLYGLGARTFLVWNVPDPGLTPAVRQFDAAVPIDVGTIATGLTVTFNQLLGAQLDVLEAMLPGLEIVRFDAFTFQNMVAANPDAFGLRVVDRACVMPNVPPFACRNPDEYLFWDGVHPTAAAHALLAEAVAAALGL